MQTSASDASAQAIRESVASAMRRYRSQDVTRRLWLAAPPLAAAALGTAVLAWWLGWSPAVPLTVLAAGAISTLVWFVAARRPAPITDAWATRVDADAGLGGELRSASWFAASEHADPWADLHLVRAARRCESLDWQAIYPSPRSGRAAALTTALAIATVVLSVTLPAAPRDGGNASAQPGTRLPGQQRLISESLPPELLEQLARLLAAAEAGDRRAVEALSSREELVDLLDNLSREEDRALLDALARALANKDAADAADALAERSRRAAESAAMSAAMRNALEQLADQLELVAPERATDAGADPSESAAMPSDGSGQSTAGAPGEQLDIQFARETDAGSSTGVMLLSEQEASGDGGAPGAGFGGAHTPEEASTASAELDAALRREVVEAHEEAAGTADRVDIQRRTEQTRATSAFTGAAAGQFEAAAVAAPPPVPETRRPGLRSYFVRAPQ